MRFEQGEHNEEVCNFLIKEKKFRDWVVTTAFYAAVHFTQHKLFPKEAYNVKFHSFEEYYSYHRDILNRPISKHAFQEELVWEINSDVGSKYKWLRDTCHHARYMNYYMSEKKAERAHSYLSQIKTACT